MCLDHKFFCRFQIPGDEGGKCRNGKEEDCIDLLDRGFFGKPSWMIIVLLAIIAFFIIKKIINMKRDRNEKEIINDYSREQRDPSL